MQTNILAKVYKGYQTCYMKHFWNSLTPLDDSSLIGLSTITFQCNMENSSQDALLASIAEAEQQTELDARVSTWKERIEHALEEQASCVVE